jgi:chemotaxis protein MotB
MSKQPIIIYRIKKKSIKGKDQRSGMWKVAYADFITAMMAFFMLLWLLSVTPENTLKGVAKYFTQTTSISDKAGLGFEGGADSNVEDGTGAPNAASSSLIFGSPSRGRRLDQASQSGMMTDLEKQHFIDVMNNIQQNLELRDYSDNINVDMTSEGLRIQIMDSDNRPMFKPNTYELQPYMNKILTVIGKMIKDQPNYIAISGHTASIKDVFKTDADYWTISSLRANEVRKFLTHDLIKQDQVVRIVGRADTEPFDIKDIYSSKNIRVGITLLNNGSVSRFQQSAPDKSFQK